MNKHNEGLQDNSSRGAVANGFPKLHDNTALAANFTANSPAYATQRKYQDNINSSSQIKQFKAIQQLANNSDQVKQLKIRQAMADQFTSNKDLEQDGKGIITNNDDHLHGSVVQQRPAGVVQRAVGLKDYRRVYMPEHLAPDGAPAKARFQTSVNTFTGRNDTVEFVNSEGLKNKITENIKKETKDLLLYQNKYGGNKAEAQKLIATASTAQENRNLSPEERKEIGDKLGRDLGDLENPVYAKNMEVMGQFAETKMVYLYATNKLLEEYDVPDEYMLLAPADMHDAPGVLPPARVEGQSCVIQTLSDLAANVNTMWDDQAASTDVDRWHAACRLKGLDYRNDNEYIKILKRLGYTLVFNTPTRYDQMDWASLGNGQYFLGTGGGGIGHAYGVRIAGDAVAQLYDRQGIQDDTDIVNYVFKKP